MKNQLYQRLAAAWAGGAILVGVASAASISPELDPTRFALQFTDGRVVTRDQLREISGPSSSPTRFAASDDSFTATLRSVAAADDEVHYVRTFLEITNRTTRELPLARIVMLDTAAPAGARVAGSVNGSPVVTRQSFFGVEHPFAQNTIVGNRVQCALPLMQPLRPGERTTASFVLGTASEPSQLRRAFLNYLEHERPRAYAPFLHHNTWYNLGFGQPFSEADELGLIDIVGRELVKKRGVRLDGFVLDDGWDDPHSLWRFHSGWPDGLKNMTAAAARFGAAPGIWLSPWGGYGTAKKARIAAAAPEGFEIRDGSFSLAGPRYYERFRELCATVVRHNGVVYFKFDGIGAKETGVIDPAAGRDFDAMLRLVAELRTLRPGLYVSQTTGTWASPWWLLHVDNIWRGGRDHWFAGVGSDRQQWITYRDALTFQNVVQRGPLFPLNSLMIHGVIYSRLAKRLSTDPADDFQSEVRSYFGTGTQLQELYLSPELLTRQNWDDLAAAAKWARDNATVLRDTHWIGGDPMKLQVYGWAAWTPDKGIVTLRNPSGKPAAFALDPAPVFELPAGATPRFRLTSPYPGKTMAVTTVQAGIPAMVDLKPFEVLVLEATPIR